VREDNLCFSAQPTWFGPLKCGDHSLLGPTERRSRFPEDAAQIPQALDLGPPADTARGAVKVSV
jgi:hypothetical protein